MLKLGSVLKLGRLEDWKLSERMAGGGQRLGNQRSERMAVGGQQSAVRRSAVSNQQSAIRKNGSRRSAVAIGRSLLQRESGRDREIAPTKSGRRSWVFLSSIPCYFFIEKTTEIRGFVPPRSLRLGACCLTILIYIV